MVFCIKVSIQNKFQQQFPQSNWLHLTIIVICLRIIQCEYYGSNQIINGNFDYIQVQNYSLYPLNIRGWTCKQFCQIDNCVYNNRQQVGHDVQIFANCTGQVLDLNSKNFNQVVTQTMKLTVGLYLLEFLYSYPFANSNKKTFLVFFNDELMFTLLPQTKFIFQTFSFSKYVIATDGINNLTFTMTGPITDSVGYKIGNISLKQVVNEYVIQTINYTLNGSVALSIVSVPTSRVVFQQLLGWLVCFDRFQLYYYHNRNFSSKAQMMLFNVNNLMNQKGSLVYDNLDNVFDPIFTIVNAFLVQTNFKMNYTSAQFLDKNSNGFGFFLNNGTTFVYALPVGVFFSIISILISKRVKRQYVFYKMAQFTLLGILLNILCEGNIEQYTFYALAQFKTFFCFDFSNKIQYVCLIVFFFVVLFTSVGSVLWFKYHYNVNARLLIENYKTRGIFICIVDKGMICLLFGAIHQLLIDLPNIQLFALFTTEVVWLFVKIHFFSNKVYEDKMLTLLGFVEGILRMIFQVVCYIYGNYNNLKFEINETIAPILIYCFTANWLLQLTVSIYCIIISFKQKIKNNNKKLKVTPQFQEGNQISDKKTDKSIEWLKQIKKGFKLSRAKVKFVKGYKQKNATNNKIKIKTAKKSKK